MTVPHTLASRIDHTVLHAEATEADAERAAGEALQYGFAAVCVNPIHVRRVRKLLEGSAARACTVIGFPLGAGTPLAKAREAMDAIDQGAQEIDIVAHLPPLLAAHEKAVHGELVQIVTEALHERTDLTLKVIVESALLMRDVPAEEAERRIAAACRAIREAGCDYIKTSTGFHPAGGASESAVRLMRQHAGGLKIKASGGIRTREQAERMLAAGADRLGCSRSVQIVSDVSERV